MSDGQKGGRSKRADAQRSNAALLSAAFEIFTTMGVDAPYRAIADAAGVGMGTIYRHYPKRSDLIIAVYRRELQICVDAAVDLAARHDPGETLTLWIDRLADFIVAKRGLASALSSEDPAFAGLPKLVEEALLPALQRLLDAAAQSGTVPQDTSAIDLFVAVCGLCTVTPDNAPGRPRRMIATLMNGLRHEASKHDLGRSDSMQHGR